MQILLFKYQISEPKDSRNLPSVLIHVLSTIPQCCQVMVKYIHNTGKVFAVKKLILTPLDSQVRAGVGTRKNARTLIKYTQIYPRTSDPLAVVFLSSICLMSYL